MEPGVIKNLLLKVNAKRSRLKAYLCSFCSKLLKITFNIRKKQFNEKKVDDLNGGNI